MARINHLGNKAEQKDMFGVALRAEELRGKVAGYHVDRSLIKTSNDLNDKTEEELTDEMKSYRKGLRDIPQNNTTEEQYDLLLARDEQGNLTNAIWSKP